MSPAWMIKRKHESLLFINHIEQLSQLVGYKPEEEREVVLVFNKKLTEYPTKSLKRIANHILKSPRKLNIKISLDFSLCTRISEEKGEELLSILSGFASLSSQVKIILPKRESHQSHSQPSLDIAEQESVKIKDLEAKVKDLEVKCRVLQMRCNVQNLRPRDHRLQDLCVVLAKDDEILAKNAYNILICCQEQTKDAFAKFADRLLTEFNHPDEEKRPGIKEKFSRSFFIALCITESEKSEVVMPNFKLLESSVASRGDKILRSIQEKFKKINSDSSEEFLEEIFRLDDEAVGYSEQIKCSEKCFEEEIKKFMEYIGSSLGVGEGSDSITPLFSGFISQPKSMQPDFYTLQAIQTFNSSIKNSSEEVRCEIINNINHSMHEHYKKHETAVSYPDKLFVFNTATCESFVAALIRQGDRPDTATHPRGVDPRGVNTTEERHYTGK